MKQVGIGMVGSGFAAELHVRAYKRVYGVDVRLRSVASIDPNAAAFGGRHGFEKVCADYRDILRDPAVDVVDIVTPPALHAQMILDAVAAGKHVICEKPLSGFFGSGGAPLPTKHEMFESVTGQMDRLREKIRASGLQFMYAENWIYFPNVEKADLILDRRDSTILMIKGEESHSGSHAAHAAWWHMNGGGSLIRQGCHPLSLAIYFKMMEGRRRGTDIRVQRVLADVGMLSRCIPEGAPRHISAAPRDVEDTATTLVTFSDGTKAVILASDIALGGIRNTIELYADNAVIQCNAAPSKEMQAYFTDDGGLDDVYLAEKLENKAGWQFVAGNEDVGRGYQDEMQDFMECVVTGRLPRSGFSLAYETIRTIYASYASAESGAGVAL